MGMYVIGKELLQLRSPMLPGDCGGRESADLRRTPSWSSWSRHCTEWVMNGEDLLPCRQQALKTAPAHVSRLVAMLEPIARHGAEGDVAKAQSDPPWVANQGPSGSSLHGHDPAGAVESPRPVDAAELAPSQQPHEQQPIGGALEEIPAAVSAAVGTRRDGYLRADQPTVATASEAVTQVSLQGGRVKNARLARLRHRHGKADARRRQWHALWQSRAEFVQRQTCIIHNWAKLVNAVVDHRLALTRSWLSSEAFRRGGRIEGERYLYRAVDSEEWATLVD